MREKGKRTRERAGVFVPEGQRTPLDKEEAPRQMAVYKVKGEPASG